MAKHMAYSSPRPLTAADSARAAQVIKELRQAIVKYQDVKVAEADGYKMFAPQIKNQPQYHFTKGWNTLRNQWGFDPARPPRDWYVRHLDKEPSLVAAAKWLSQEKLEHEDFHPQVQRALDQAAKPLTRYRCAACGFEARQHFWQCPGCQSWDSYPARRVEEL